MSLKKTATTCTISIKINKRPTNKKKKIMQNTLADVFNNRNENEQYKNNGSNKNKHCVTWFHKQSNTCT